MCRLRLPGAPWVPADDVEPVEQVVAVDGLGLRRQVVPPSPGPPGLTSSAPIRLSGSAPGGGPRRVIRPRWDRRSRAGPREPLARSDRCHWSIGVIHLRAGRRRRRGSTSSVCSGRLVGRVVRTRDRQQREGAGDGDGAPNGLTIHIGIVRREGTGPGRVHEADLAGKPPRGDAPPPGCHPEIQGSMSGCSPTPSPGRVRTVDGWPTLRAPRRHESHQVRSPGLPAVEAMAGRRGRRSRRRHGDEHRPQQHVRVVGRSPSHDSRRPPIRWLSGRTSERVCIGPVMTSRGGPPPPSRNIGMNSRLPKRAGGPAAGHQRRRGRRRWR